MLVEAAALTDPGRHRHENEDSLAAFTPADPLVRERKGSLYVIADGLGGHAAGDVASSTAATTTVHEYYSPSNHSRIEPALRNAVQSANLRVHNLAMSNPAYHSMETTLTAVALAGAHAYVAHVGDCRLYHWRAGQLTQLTADHSEAAELVRMRVLKPEKVRDHPGRSVLTRSLGGRLILRPDFSRHPLAAGDRLALCSDGLWSELEEAELAQAVGDCAPPDACRALIDLALARDCDDNISIQVVNVLAVSAEADRGSSRNGWLSSIFQRGDTR